MIARMCRPENRFVSILYLLLLTAGLFVNQAASEVFNVGSAAELTNAFAVAADNGEDDTIRISAGTYELSDTLTYDSDEENGLVIESNGGEVILYAGSRRIAYIWARANSTNASITISGITFRDGFVNESQGAGAFIRSQKGNVTVRNSRFNGCRSSSVFGSSQAAGLYARIEGLGELLLADNIFSNNVAKGIGGGAQLIGGSGVSVHMRNNLFRDNDGNVQGGGASVYVISGNISCQNNTFVGNWTSSGNGGGGLYVGAFGNSSVISLLNNTFRTNVGVNALGEDLYVEDDSDGDGTGCAARVERNAYVDMDYHVGDNLSVSGNTDSDPLLDSNLHLQAGSPCIDTGTNQEWMADATDLAGTNRIIGNSVDMGAYEYVPDTSESDLSAAITVPTNNARFNEPADIDIEAAASVSAPASVTQAVVYANGEAIYSVAAGSVQCVWANVSAGAYAFSMQAWDSNGSSVTSASISVSVISASITNDLSAAITQPTNSAVYKAPADIAVQAYSSVSSPSFITQTVIHVGSDTVYSTTTNSAEYSMTDTAAGSYSISCAAWDNNGQSVTSACITITVNEQTPVVDPERSAVYRLYSCGSAESTYEHLWTTSEAERDILDSWPSWLYEGIAWYAYTNQQGESIPLYRLYAESVKQHHYTIDTTEYSVLAGNGTWAGEGIQYYVFANQSETGVYPAYRFYHSGLYLHHFTIDENEKEQIIANPSWGYTYEGIGYYVFGTNVASSVLGDKISRLTAPAVLRQDKYSARFRLLNARKNTADRPWPNERADSSESGVPALNVEDTHAQTDPLSGSISHQPFDILHSIVVPGDYNGDGIEDIAWYEESTGNWYFPGQVGESDISDMKYQIAPTAQWGGPGFLPVAGDYNGDGISDLAVYHVETGRWFIREFDLSVSGPDSTGGGVIVWNVRWGGEGMLAVPGDFDEDSISDLAVLDCLTYVYYVRSVSGTVLLYGEEYGSRD